MAKVKKRSTLKVWGDVIFAIFLREVKSKNSDKLGITWLVVSPVIFIFLLSYIRGRLDGGEVHGIPTFNFMAIGMILVQIFLSVVAATASAIKKNKPLYAFRQVQPISSVIAVSGLMLLVKIFVFLLIILICLYMRYDMQVADPLGVIFNVFRVWLLASSIGLMFSLAACYVPEVDKIRSLLMRPIFFISGIFFSLQDMPEEVWPYLTWNPILHAVELTRYAAYPVYGNAGVNYLYLNLVTFFCVFFSIVCYYTSWKQAISR
ncbi:ABC transporter permease [Vibrio astriarenae]